MRSVSLSLSLQKVQTVVKLLCSHMTSRSDGGRHGPRCSCWPALVRGCYVNAQNAEAELGQEPSFWNAPGPLEGLSIW